jgi:hypothetical protein
MQFQVAQRDTARAIVGDEGLSFLDRLLPEMESEASRRGWPLRRVSVYPYVDWEFEGRQYLVVWLEFGCPAEIASRMLANLNPIIERHLSRLTTAERGIIGPRVRFDVQAAG